MKKITWQVDHKLESLEAWVRELNEEARIQFLKAGLHVELLMVFSDNGPTTMLPVYRISHDEAVGRLINLVHEHHAYAVAHIVSCIIDLPIKQCENIHLQVPDSDSDLDNGDEFAQLLVVHAHSRDHSNITYFNPVVRTNDSLLMMDPIRLDVPFKGRFEVEL